MHIEHGLVACLILSISACGGDEPQAAPEPAPVASVGDEAGPAETSDPEPATEEQSFAEALDIICNQWTAEESIQNAAPENKARLMARWISERLTNQRAIDMFEALASMSPEQRHEDVSAAAEAEGLASCAIVEVWASP